jgi:DNA-nicking Smr family endonuclease
MGRKTRRSLTSEDKELWGQVAGSAIPIRRSKLVEILETTPPPTRKREASVPLLPFSMGQNTNPLRSSSTDLKPSLGQSLAKAPVQMDKKSFTHMKRGRLAPEGRIDLHGMTLSEAHPALTSFILNAFTDRKRLVLVITGKGKDKPEYDFMPVQRGILRHQVPQWLRMAPLMHCVLQISQSHIKHGGEGAYYVYLRRQR